ncbi:MAG: cold-shock protein [Gemmatimonadota bacterium]|jgi:CspA family cold shock protein|nr:cold-shock protein [Gemmatimonadota bacterium]MDP6529659.1 cold-shock protein [Gemmatimonadota bacterium]MDP6802669.1 cold-shock protein [Gemmatimonadota bacterium]MDP7031668.1 cold-shock protein [Gemmatimonadota bacterium]
MHEGTVKWFNDSMGFGFISRESGRDVYVHFTAIRADGFRTLNEGDQVHFEVKAKGRGLHAENVIKV